MTHFLEAIIIEGREGKQRRLGFRPGVNIITGGGSKGKSTVLHIIAYCLGATRCDIPVGKVRDYASWYFLVLNAGKGRALIGRKAPAIGAKVSDEAYFDQGSDPTVPRPVFSNHSVWSACRSLGELIGLPRGEFRLQDNSIYEDLDVVHGSLEMQDVLPLLLQPQDVIATSRLFASFTERPAKDRTEMMKIALGIVSPNFLHLRAQRDKLTKRKRAFEREEKVQKEIYQKAMSNLGHIWQQAIFAGVVVSRPLTSPDQVRTEVENLKTVSTVEVSLSATDKALLAELDSRSQTLRREMRQISRDLHQIDRLKQVAREAELSLHAESSRMRVVDLLGVPMQTDVVCPLCGSGFGENAVSVLAEMQTELDAELAFTASIPPRLDTAESTLQDKAVRIRKDLREVERRLDDLRKQEPALTLTQERVERERKIGSLETALGAMTTAPGRHSGLDAVDAELNEVENKLQSLPEEREALNVARALSSRMTSVAREFEKMNLNDGFLKFDDTFSTIEREQGGKRELLDILGGAEIYVMHHIAAFLGMHEYLSEPETKSFVPRFLVFDQPSQAYFPAESDQNRTDMVAVRAIYDLIFRFVARLENRIQIIVLDHADFSGEDEQFDDVRINWHGNDGLINDDADGP
jgi:hypothetical protein